MSIYIKNMEMPKDGCITITVTSDGRVVGNSKKESGKFEYLHNKVIAKAIPVPPNERLIDASKLNITKRALDAKRDYLLLAEKDMDCEYEQGFWDGLAVACGEIRKAKTIIPADKEG